MANQKPHRAGRPAAAEPKRIRPESPPAAPPPVPPSTHWTPLILTLCVLFPTLVYFFQVARIPLDQFASQMITEDAFYYLVPAKNFVRSLVFSLDGRNATNGFQPLWMSAAVAIMAVLSDPLAQLRAISAGGFLVVLSSAMVYLRLCPRSWAYKTVFGSLLLFSPLFFYWSSGMESGVAAASLVGLLAFTYTLKDGFPSQKKMLALGALLACAALSRLDYALLLPLVALALGALAVTPAALAVPARTRFTRLLLPLLLPVACLSLYVLGNLVFFGSIFPASMMAKGHIEKTGLPAGTHFSTALSTLKPYLINLIPVLLGGEDHWVPRQFNLFPGLRTLGAFRVLSWAVVLLSVAGLALRAKAGLRSLAPGRFLRLALFLFAGLQMVVYVFTYPLFATQSGYINWYYVPQVLLVIELIASVFDSAVGFTRRHFQFQLAPRVVAHSAAAAALLIIFSIGYTHCVIVTARPDVNQWITAARLLNRHTPQGTRIAGFSVGTQAFFLEGNRVISNLDGVINSPEFVRTYLRQGAIERFLKDQKVEYLSDHLGDVATDDVYFSNSVIDHRWLTPLTQWPSWDAGTYSIARIDFSRPAQPLPESLIFPAPYNAHGPKLDWGRHTVAEKLVLAPDRVTEAAVSLAPIGKQFKYLKIQCDVQPVDRRPAAPGGLLYLLVSAHGFPGLLKSWLPGNRMAGGGERHINVFVERTPAVSDLGELFILSESGRFDIGVDNCTASELPWGRRP
ncbi:hypothetical protein [Paludibaculum fermentans]|uniref:hypothetical protein n=1 Tax=Paludibaculum fermentans TaxID=1473598 RepID=UPI003EBCF981